MTTAHPSDRTVRQRTLPQLGDSGQELLAGATVAVVGAGGLGSPVIQYLAAAGIGTLHVIDDDRVELSNLNRQTLHGMDTLGGLKTDGAVAAAARLSPETTVVPHTLRLTDANASELLGPADVIIDGSDSFDTRFIVHRAALALGRPVVFGALFQWNAQVTVFWSAPPAGSGLSPVVLTDVFPDNAATHAAPGCAEAGVLGAVVGITGSFLALEAVKLILGTGRPLIGRMLLIDGLAGTTSEIPLAGSAGRDVPRRPGTVIPTSAPPGPRSGSRPSGPSGPGTTVPTPADTLPQQVPGLRPIAVQDVSPSHVWVDVRRPEESAARPGPVSTVLFPLDRVLRLDQGPDTVLPPDHPLAGIGSSRPLLPFCAAGPRSATAARHLAGLGWPVAGYLDGGLPDSGSAPSDTGESATSPEPTAPGTAPGTAPAVGTTPDSATGEPEEVHG